MGNAPSGHAPLLLEEKTSSPIETYLVIKSRSDALCAAARSRNLTSLQRLISLKNGLSKQDQEGFSAIHYVVLSQWSEGLQSVIDANADVNARSAQGYTPLQLASYLGNVPCVRILLDAGANIEAKTVRNSTALLLAAQQGTASKDALSLLLSRGANVAQTGFRNRTALQLAVHAHGREEVIKMLAEAGADPSVGNPEMHNNTPLHTAASLQRYGAMRALIAAGADPNKVSDLGLTPVMEIFLADNVHGESVKRMMVRDLSRSGADLNIVVPDKGFTALHLAVMHSQVEGTVDTLLSLDIDPSIGIDLHPSATSRNTMLHIAAKRGWANVINKLVEAGADWTLRNKEGLTPLLMAVVNRRPSAVQALLAAGVNPFQAGPDIWPTYAQWKVQRGVRAIEALMNGPIPLASAEDLLARINGSEEMCSAVDTACAVVQDIEIVEAFLAVGAKPSEAALALATECVPIMRMVVERPLWTPEIHKNLPVPFQERTRLLLRCLKRASSRPRNPLPTLTSDALACILTSAMYPISRWANPGWMARQKVKEPTEVERPNHASANNANDDNNNGNGHGIPFGPGPVPQIMQLMPEIMEQVLHHIQLEVAAGMEAGELMAHVPVGPAGVGNNVEVGEGAIGAQLMPPGGGGDGDDGPGPGPGVAMIQFQLHPPQGMPLFPPFLAGVLPAALAAGMPPFPLFPGLFGPGDSDDEEEEEEVQEEEPPGLPLGAGFVPAFAPLLAPNQGHLVNGLFGAEAGDAEEAEDEDDGGHPHIELHHAMAAAANIAELVAHLEGINAGMGQDEDEDQQQQLAGVQAGGADAQGPAAEAENDDGDGGDDGAEEGGPGPSTAAASRRRPSSSSQSRGRGRSAAAATAAAAPSTRSGSAGRGNAGGSGSRASRARGGAAAAATGATRSTRSRGPAAQPSAYTAPAGDHEPESGRYNLRHRSGNDEEDDGGRPKKRARR